MKSRQMPTTVAQLHERLQEHVREVETLRFALDLQRNRCAHMFIEPPLTLWPVQLRPQAVAVNRAN